MAPGWQFEEILPALTRRAARALHDMSREEKPFFPDVAPTSPHEPVSPPAAFRGRSGIAPVADFLKETDRAGGEVLQALEESGCAAKLAAAPHASLRGRSVACRAGGPIHLPIS
jgi:arylsulfatase A